MSNGVLRMNSISEAAGQETQPILDRRNKARISPPTKAMANATRVMPMV